MLAVLGLKPPVSVADVKQAYLDKAKTAHPDHGGDPQDFIRLQQAFEQATEYAKFKAGRMQWLSGWVEQYAEQQQIIEEVKALGGSAEVEGVEWLGQTIGTDFATVMDRLAAVRLSGPQVDDAAFVPLAARLRRQAGLHRIALQNTRISEAGLAELILFENLRELDLSGTPLTLDDVELLVHKLDRLEKLTLTDTGLGWAARLKLRFSHRNLEIVT
ncbi:MAG: hypothetical protein AB7E98_24890 [Pirellulales bacterium]